MKRILSIVTIALLLTACQPSQPPSSEEIVIGGLFALTGYGSHWGAAEYEGALLAVKQANKQGGIDGTQVRLIAEDTQTDATATVNAFTKLTDSGVNFLVGPTWETNTITIAQQASEMDIILISPSASKAIEDQHSNHLFSTYPPLSYEIRGLENYFAKEGLSRFVVISNQEFFSESVRSLFVLEAQRNNWTIVESFALAESQKQYQTVLQKIKSMEVDAVYAPLSSPVQLGTLKKQMREMQVDLPLFGVSSIEDPNLLTVHGTEADGIIYPYPVQAPGNEAFEAAFFAEYNKKPGSPSAANAYDAMNLIVESLRSGARASDEVAAYLHSLRDYQGASNTITFTRDGLIEKKEHKVKTIRDGKFTYLE